MEILTVNTEGKLVIPPEVIHGLRPGDEISLLETGRGLLVCREGLALLDDWWHSLTEEEKIEARAEAEWYEFLTDAERDALWQEEDAEGDEIDVEAVGKLNLKQQLREGAVNRADRDLRLAEEWSAVEEASASGSRHKFGRS